MRTLLSLAVLFAVAAPAPAAEKDIVATAASTPELRTLTAAIKAAGLADTLKGAGPFTVLAPTDEAFAKLPEGTLQGLLKPGNKGQLVKVLTYHVIPGKSMASDVVKLDGKSVKTVQGAPVMIRVEGGKTVMVGDAKVIMADVDCSNGVVHVIDSVILPPKVAD